MVRALCPASQDEQYKAFRNDLGTLPELIVLMHNIDNRPCHRAFTRLSYPPRSVGEYFRDVAMPAPHTKAILAPAPAFTALLFGLSGCLVDFGARAPALLARGALNAQQQDVHAKISEQASVTPGALAILQTLSRQGVPCAWLEELPGSVSQCLAAPLGKWIQPADRSSTCADWPAPDACWQALMTLNVKQLDGCVLVSGEPRLLQSGLNAGLWTVGLASCGPLCGLSPSDWQALSSAEREHRRGQATLQLYGLGVHSVIDHLGELASCLADISLRRTKGEKP